MSDTEKATAITLQFLAYRPGVRSRLTDAIDLGVRAQALEGDRTSGHTTVTDENGYTIPAVSDPTGETAVSEDRARTLLRDLDRAEDRLLRAMYRLCGHPIADMASAAQVLCAYTGKDQPTNRALKGCAQVFDRVIAETYSRWKPKAGESADGEPGCQSCGRLKVDGVPYWSPPSYNRGNPTDLGGMLPSKALLCKPCRDWICRDPDATVYRYPTADQLRVKRKTGRWPKDTDVTKRYSAA